MSHTKIFSSKEGCNDFFYGPLHDSIKYSNPELLRDQNCQHLPSILFNLRILYGKTASAILSSYFFKLNGVDILAYQLSADPNCFLIHGTIYNIPLGLINISEENSAQEDFTVLGYTIYFSELLRALNLISTLTQKNTARRKVNRHPTIMVANTNNLGHYIWNDLSGQVLYNSLHTGIIHYSKPRYWVGRHDFLDYYQQNTRFPKTNIHEISIRISRSKTLKLYGGLNSLILRLTAFKLGTEVIHQTKKLIIDSKSSSALECSHFSKKAKNRHVIIFSLRSGSRRWLKQIETISKSSISINKSAPIFVIIDGYSRHRSCHNNWPAVLVKEFIASKVIMLLLAIKKIPSTTIINRLLTDKIFYYDTCLLLVQPIGSANIIPGWFLGKQLLLFGSQRMAKLSNIQDREVINSVPNHCIIPAEREDARENIYISPGFISFQVLHFINMHKQESHIKRNYPD